MGDFIYPDKPHFNQNTKLQVMHILVTGGTGFIGSRLTRKLLDQNNVVYILTRSPEKRQADADQRAHLIGSLDNYPSDLPVDAVINLAGEQLVGHRWTKARKQRIRQSRIDLTAQLVKWLGEREQTPNVLISGSAIGFYGDTGDQVIDESAAIGDDFGAILCDEWEQQALAAKAHGIRTCVIRTGLVLGTEGGMLKQMYLPFKFGLGSRISNGKQWMSWIHIDDQINAILYLLDNNAAQGNYNLTAPNPSRNRDFTKALASALKSFAVFVTPAALIHFGLGESGRLLTGGQKVLPGRLLKLGFSFKFERLDDALQNIYPQ